MLSMMRDVCVSGTAAQAASLKRPDITGKTGTTDDCTDAWFVGSNPELTTGVWLGHDAKISLGKSEHGGTAALPVWMDVMKDALKHKPVGVYPVPEGVLFMDDLREQGSGGSPLAAHPDFSPSPELKQIAPADAVYMSDSGQADGEYGSEVNPAAYASPGAGVRILSRAGETLGYGEYARDKNGKPVVYPFSPAPTGTQAAYPGYQAYPGYPQEAGVYGTVPEAPVRAQVGSQPGNPYFSPQQGYPAR
jgi:penicillin-binding protein 1A